MKPNKKRPASGHSVSGRIKDVDSALCSHAVKFDYWFEDPTQTWHARITFTEERQRRQYGGAVVKEITHRGRDWRTSHKNFLARVRSYVKEQLDTFWT